MGGCRCTYRNCTVRSDGITHMFHYPVFDKVRCPQWLINAHKLEFLNLKVSQLKNRVVCQHHFVDKCFMNFKKDKLTFYAVPTLDGPYCDPSLYDLSNSEEVSKMYNITLDDIENEHLTLTDKKANFSVKYGNFLTNGEMMDLDPINNINNNKHVIKKKKANHEIYEKSVNSNTLLLNENQKDSLITMNIEPLPVYQTNNPVVIGIDFEELQLNAKTPEDRDRKDFVSNPLLITNNIINNENNIVTESEVLSNPLIPSNKINNNNDSKVNEKRVKIISEKEITKPIRPTGDLEPLSPSLTIRIPKHKIFKSKIKGVHTYINNKESLTKVLGDTCSAFVEPEKKLTASMSQKSHENNTFITKYPGKISKNATNKITYSPSKSLLKNKNDPDRVAAIEEKRKFNMKLRDIIESCFDKIDDQEKPYDENLEKNVKVQQQDNTKVGAFLSKEEELPSLQEYTIACLVGRIQRMENLLMSKIDQNSKRILDLKNSIGSSDKQTINNEKTKNLEQHKRQLYKEISQYLSPDANSLIYEELFINKFIQKAPKSSPSPKRRKKR